MKKVTEEFKLVKGYTRNYDTYYTDDIVEDNMSVLEARECFEKQVASALSRGAQLDDIIIYRDKFNACLMYNLQETQAEYDNRVRDSENQAHERKKQEELAEYRQYLKLAKKYETEANVKKLTRK